MPHSFHTSFTNWLTHSLLASLTYSWPHCSTLCLTHSLHHSFLASFTNCLTHSLPALLSLTPFLTHLLSASLTPSISALLNLPHSLNHSLTPCLNHSLSYSLPPSLLSHSLTPCLTHSLPHSPSLLYSLPVSPTPLSHSFPDSLHWPTFEPHSLPYSFTPLHHSASLTGLTNSPPHEWVRQGRGKQDMGVSPSLLPSNLFFIYPSRSHSNKNSETYTQLTFNPSSCQGYCLPLEIPPNDAHFKFWSLR